MHRNENQGAGIAFELLTIVVSYNEMAWLWLQVSVNPMSTLFARTFHGKTRTIITSIYCYLREELPAMRKSSYQGGCRSA